MALCSTSGAEKAWNGACKLQRRLYVLFNFLNFELCSKVMYEPTGRWAHMACAVLGRGAEPPQFWVLLIWLDPGSSHVTWVHYDATMCLACFVCSILPVLHFLRFGLCVL